MLPSWPLAQPFPLSCALWPRLFLCLLAVSLLLFGSFSCRAAAHGTLGSQRAPVLSTSLSPWRVLWIWYPLGVAMVDLRAGGASFCLNFLAPVSITTGCEEAVAATWPLSSDARRLVWICMATGPHLLAGADSAAFTVLHKDYTSSMWVSAYQLSIWNKTPALL